LQAKADNCRIEPQAILPVVFDGFLPTVTAKINGVELIMGFDTGAQGTIITPETARNLHLHPTSQGHLKTVTVKSFNFAGNWRENVTLAVIPLPLKHLRNRKVAGLIGTNVLANYDIDYDPRRREISLYTVADCVRIKPLWKGTYIKIPVSITRSHRMAVPVKLNGYPLTAIFDTGSSGLRLAWAAASKAGLTQKELARDPWMNVRSAGASHRARVHHFRKIEIGNEEFVGPHIQVVPFPSKEAEMLLGANYMHRRRFWLSFSTHTLFIQNPQH
jgi:predicted aspartyl protease